MELEDLRLEIAGDDGQHTKLKTASQDTELKTYCAKLATMAKLTDKTSGVK